MISFRIDDMTCGHCASTITRAVRDTDAAATLQFDLPAHRVQIEPATASADELAEAIREAGYTPQLVTAAG